MLLKIYIVVLLAALRQCSSYLCDMQPMMTRTVLNSEYQGVLVNMSVPAEVFTRADGKPCARVGAAVPIHCCEPDEVKERAKTTHHYAGIFTEETLAPLPDVAYVRIDENTVEKVQIEQGVRVLVTSHDGRLAQWRAAPTFRSANRFVAGAPLVDAAGRLVSLLTARHGDHYAVVNIQGPGGYFETACPWKEVGAAPGLVYADRVLPSREALREYLASLPPGLLSPDGSLQLSPVLHARRAPRVVLAAAGGRQAAHIALDGDVRAERVHYL